ncbi:MAG: hypothetical protein ABR585_11865 [Gemmatimonadaceae bacterium]
MSRPLGVCRTRVDSRVRPGFVLAASLLALLLIAALVAAVFFATTEETRTGAALELRQRAFLESESSLAGAMVSLARTTIDSLPIGGTTNIGGGGSSSVRVYLTRLDSTLCWLVADAEAKSNSAAASRIGLLVRVSSDSNHSIIIDRIPERGWSELF